MAERGRLRGLAGLFVRLGVTAFGGPAAHIAMMHDEVVRRRGWLDDRGFLDMVGATNLIPGPNSTEMAMHVGHRRAGWRGLVVAGAAFILPAVAIVLAFSWAYVAHGATPAGQALLYGIVPVVIAIIAQALVRLGRRAVTGWGLGTLGVAATAASLAGVDELVVLAASALVVLAVRARLWVGAVLVLPAWSAADATATAGDVALWRLGLVFLKVGAVLYGSGYVLLAFLRTDLVDRLAVLTEAQLLDAVAVGQFTPGPVLTTATFVGYVTHGLPGAAVATVGIFLPSFVLVGMLARVLPRVRDRAWAAALLDAVNVASLGLMAAVTLDLGGAALTDALTVAIAAVTGLLLWRTELSSAWLVLGGAAVGLAAAALGVPGATG